MHCPDAACTVQPSFDARMLTLRTATANRGGKSAQSSRSVFGPQRCGLRTHGVAGPLTRREQGCPLAFFQHHIFAPFGQSWHGSSGLFTAYLPCPQVRLPRAHQVVDAPAVHCRVIVRHHQLLTDGGRADNAAQRRDANEPSDLRDDLVSLKGVGCPPSHASFRVFGMSLLSFMPKSLTERAELFLNAGLVDHQDVVIAQCLESFSAIHIAPPSLPFGGVAFQRTLLFSARPLLQRVLTEVHSGAQGAHSLVPHCRWACRAVR